MPGPAKNKNVTRPRPITNQSVRVAEASIPCSRNRPPKPATIRTALPMAAMRFQVRDLIWNLLANDPPERAHGEVSPTALVG